jgi:hypothetical protein
MLLNHARESLCKFNYFFSLPWNTLFQMFCSYGFVFGFNTDLCYIFFEIQIITVSYSTLFGTPFKLLLLTLVQMDYIAFELIPLSQGQQ